MPIDPGNFQGDWNRLAAEAFRRARERGRRNVEVEAVVNPAPIDPAHDAPGNWRVMPDHDRRLVERMQQMAEFAGHDEAGPVNWDETPEVPRQLPPLEGDCSNRRFTRKGIPSFHLPYDSIEDITHRLYNTVILVKDDPYYVTRIEKKSYDYLLRLKDGEGNYLDALYNANNLDVRPIPPMYITMDGAAHYIYRIPERQQLQGASTKNTAKKTAGSDGYGYFRSITEILNPMKNSSDNKWSPYILDFMEKRILHSIRLTDKICAFWKDAPFVEFKGRTLGKIRDDRVKLDACDKEQPWIRTSLIQANLLPV